MLYGRGVEVLRNNDWHSQESDFRLGNEREKDEKRVENEPPSYMHDIHECS